MKTKRINRAEKYKADTVKDKVKGLDKVTTVQKTNINRKDSHLEANQLVEDRNTARLDPMTKELTPDLERIR